MAKADTNLPNTIEEEVPEDVAAALAAAAETPSDDTDAPLKAPKPTGQPEAGEEEKEAAAEAAKVKAAEAAKVKAAAAAAAGVDVEPPVQETVEEVVFDLPGSITIDEKTGEMTWNTNPKNPNATIYKGKDLKEIIDNASKGIQHKDTLIQEGKAKKPSAAPEHRTLMPQAEATAEIEEPRPFDEILADQYTKHKVNVERLNWTDEQWNQWAEKEGKREWQIGREVNRVQQHAEVVRQQAMAIADGETIKWYNSRIFDQETEVVAQMLDDHGISENDFDYDAVLDRVRETEANYEKNGNIKSGRIIREAEKEIRQVSQTRRDADLKRKIGERVASGKRVKYKIRATPGGGPAKPAAAPAPKGATTTEEALAGAMKDLPT